MEKMPPDKYASVKKQGPRPECPIPKGKLLAIGGKESKGSQPQQGSSQQNNTNFADMQILERFRDELKGKSPLVGIVTTPSNEPEEMAKTYIEAFHKIGLKNLQVIDIRNRKDAAREEYMEMAKQTAGIIFTGGDQLRITSILGGTPFIDVLKDRYTHDEFIIAGTSAGATALSTPMIYTGQSDGGFKKGDVYITTGLEFMRDVAIDTHFIARGRLYRVAQCIATNPMCCGIGLEEDTGVLVTEGRHIEVVGSGLITIVDGSQIGQSNIADAEPGEPVSMQNLILHMLKRGEKFLLLVADQQHK